MAHSICLIKTLSNNDEKKFRFFVFDYLNDLPSVSKCLTFHLFADTNIYSESPELSNVEKVVNRDLRKVRK